MKRIVDLIFSILALTFLSPLMLLVAIQVRRKLGKPIFFKQMRPGLRGEPFQLVKFRTMIDKYDANGNLLPDSARLSNFGKFLRSTSLDELPELWNVLKGEMSFVGPRPLLMEYMGLYSAKQSHRHDVRPGITGYAQVNGRNNLSWAKRFELDLWYVENRSILLDLRILFLTVVRVFKREGISQEGAATMEKFKGDG